MDDVYKKSSFVNVTLSFWTNENGLAISPENYQRDAGIDEQPLKPLSQTLSTKTNTDSVSSLSLGDNSLVSSSSSRTSVEKLINSLLSDGELVIENYTQSLSNRDSTDSTIATLNSYGNVSRIAKTLFENVTNLTNNSNDTFRCFSNDLVTNECLLANHTLNTTNTTLVVSHPDKVFWALFLVILPILALFGNILVILSVYKERSLQTVTNWFIVSLAFADLFVTIPMLFSLYVMVNVVWELGPLLCDLYIAIDVICSTASIFNLVAISFDRYIAVTHPIFYSKHKNDKRVIFTIVIVWIASAGVGLPIVLGANTSPNRIPELCIFYNSNFIIYSSLWSFYVPCVIMVILYYKIFKAIHNRAKRAIGSRRTYSSTNASENIKSVLVIENTAQTQKFQEELQLQKTVESVKTIANNNRLQAKLPLITETDPITHTGSGGSNAEDDDEDEDEDEEKVEMVECHVIKNKQTLDAEFMLNVTNVTSGVQRRANKKVLQSPIDVEVTIGINGNTDSGYAPSNIEDTQFCVQNPTTESPTDNKSSPDVKLDGDVLLVVESVNKNGNATKLSSKESSVEPSQASTGHNYHLHHQKHNDSVSHSSHGSTTAPTGTGLNTHLRQPKKKSRFNLGRKHKSSRKKREKASAKRERKATKTLAIVLGVFLLCWTPFFSCNILDAICIKLEENEFVQTDCRPGMTSFLLTTWLGYMNSCANPLIYTIFNPEFRKAFRKILAQPFN